MLEIYPLLSDMIFKLCDFILVISNNHLTLLKISLQILSFFQKTFPNTFFLISFFLYELEPWKETFSFSNNLLIKLINLKLFLF